MPPTDALGDRMKQLERVEAGRMLMPGLPALARIDGRCFSSFTRGLARPYDERLSELMMATTNQLIQETNACIGYTQSDEISLAWLSTDPKSEIFFNGRVQKMISILASLATLHFNRLCPLFLPEEYVVKLGHFDCRVWNVPNETEGANCFLWREQDATKNSIAMAAQSVYSHKELHGKHTGEMQEMLFQKGINWNDYPRFFRRGTFIQRRVVSRKFSVEELEKLPPKHEARTNPDLMVDRTEYRVVDMPPFAKVINREGVVFRGEEPRVAPQELSGR